MNTAEKIIEKFGGQTALATLIGKRQSTVQYWSKAGIIPAKWQPKLLKLAGEKRINLIPQDFIDRRSQGFDVTVETPKKLPQAKYSGFLKISETLEIPCYVLDDGRRIISRTGVTSALTEKSSSDLESYIGVASLQEYISPNIYNQMIEFEIGVPKTTMGIEADTFLDICKAYVRAKNDDVLKTPRQIDIAKRAAIFLMACSKVGLIALIDEATGFQYDREQDALQFKLRVYLADEMRPWEKTFPDELWKEFGRLTNWTGSVLQRPKYWGKLVMELIYDYLDKDVADWLRDNAPKPRGNLSYHRWLTSQYGLKKLVEHIWMIIGMAKTCFTMAELREKVATQFGRQMVQLSMFLPPPSHTNSEKANAENQDK